MKLKFEQYDNIYIVPGATDMRLSYTGLSAIVSYSLNLDPTANNLYLFCNKSKKTIKMLEFDCNGYIIHAKKIINKDKFYWPRKEDNLESIIVDIRQLYWLLEGLSIYQEQAFKGVEIAA